MLFGASLKCHLTCHLFLSQAQNNLKLQSLIEPLHIVCRQWYSIQIDSKTDRILKPAQSLQFGPFCCHGSFTFTVYLCSSSFWQEDELVPWSVAVTLHQLSSTHFLVSNTKIVILNFITFVDSVGSLLSQDQQMKRSDRVDKF